MSSKKLKVVTYRELLLERLISIGIPEGISTKFINELERTYTTGVISDFEASHNWDWEVKLKNNNL